MPINLSSAAGSIYDSLDPSLETGLSAIRLTFPFVEYVDVMHYKWITLEVFVSCFCEAESLRAKDVTLTEVQPLQHFTCLMLQTEAGRQGHFILLGCKNIHCDKILLCFHLSSGHAHWSTTTAATLPFFGVGMYCMLTSSQSESGLLNMTTKSQRFESVWVNELMAGVTRWKYIQNLGANKH